MRIIFCLPGKTISSNYFNSWNATIAELNKRGIGYAYCMGYDPVVYYARNRILGGKNTAGKLQKPWQGQLSYDKMVWIDSDIVWTADDIIRLIEHDVDIIAGTYLMDGGHEFPIVENLDYSKLSADGSFKFMSKIDMANKSTSFIASYTGFGFVAIKAGVLEAMEYPWFRPKWVETDSFYDFCAEDVGFCWTANDLGYDIWIDPKIKVGHEKSAIF